MSRNTTAPNDALRARAGRLLAALSWLVLAAGLAGAYVGMTQRDEVLVVAEVKAVADGDAALERAPSQVELHATMPDGQDRHTALVLCLPSPAGDTLREDAANWSLLWLDSAGESFEEQALDTRYQTHTLKDGQTCVVMPPVTRVPESDVRVVVRGVAPLDDDHAPRAVFVDGPPIGRLGLVSCLGLLLAMLLRLAAWSWAPRGRVEADWRAYDGFVGILLVLLVGAAMSSALSPSPRIVARLETALSSAEPATHFELQGALAAMFVVFIAHVAVYVSLCWGYARARAQLAGRALGIIGTPAVWAVAPFVAGTGLALAANVLLVLFAPEGPSEMQWLTVVPGTIFVTAAVACLSPWFEELFFRGFLFGAIEGVGGRHVAAIVSAGLFALAHVPQHVGYLVPMVPIAAVAVATSWLRWRTGSVVPAFALHLGYNTLLVIPALLA